MSVAMLGARPHSHEASTNSSTLTTNKRTWPKRCDSQPVRGTAIALATAKLVMTQVPWLGLTPRSPAMAGSETLAIDVSSTFMKVAADRAIVPHMRAEPSSGGWAIKAGAEDMADRGKRLNRPRLSGCSPLRPACRNRCVLRWPQ